MVCLMRKLQLYSYRQLISINDSLNTNPELCTTIMLLKSENSESIARRLTEIIRMLIEGEALCPKALVNLFRVTPRTIRAT